ncbi:hypothetical protein Heshes_11450 [Alicyclobacillus hesperidum]|uniref:Uncharacterized protein n=1 Tax=Alicyclobacillus hesperidum TaxID=89784 RepID=A0AA37X1E8_9BACL|nr:hypothetical protein Heshes_11450 [Alicyclobacillus hesperidum]
MPGGLSAKPRSAAKATDPAPPMNKSFATLTHHAISICPGSLPLMWVPICDVQSLYFANVLKQAYMKIRVFATREVGQASAAVATQAA